jgi:hypothetical protein
MVAAAGAGPAPILYHSLNSRNLADSIRYCLTPEAVIAAKSISERMKTESGVKAAVESFHASLPSESLQCDLIADQPAAWVCKDGKKLCKISKLAASILFENSKLSLKNLKL